MRQLINAHDDGGTAHPSRRRFGIGLLVGLSFLAGMAFAPAFADAKDKPLADQVAEAGQFVSELLAPLG